MGTNRLAGCLLTCTPRTFLSHRRPVSGPTMSQLSREPRTLGPPRRPGSGTGTPASSKPCPTSTPTSSTSSASSSPRCSTGQDALEPFPLPLSFPRPMTEFSPWATTICPSTQRSTEPTGPRPLACLKYKASTRGYPAPPCHSALVHVL